MFYYPSKSEIYAIKLKNHIMKKAGDNYGKTEFRRRISAVKLLEALSSQPYYESTDVQEFIRGLFLRLEAVRASEGRKTDFSVTGGGSFLLERRLLTYLILEISASCDRIKVIISNNGLVIYGNLPSSNGVASICSKLAAVRIEHENLHSIVGIPLKQTNNTGRPVPGLWDSLADKFSPEYLWL